MSKSLNKLKDVKFFNGSFYTKIGEGDSFKLLSSSGNFKQCVIIDVTKEIIYVSLDEFSSELHDDLTKEFNKFLSAKGTNKKLTIKEFLVTNYLNTIKYKVFKRIKLKV